MNLEQHRATANEWIAEATSRNASSEHPESLKLAAAGRTILSLCDEIDRLTPATESTPEAEPVTAAPINATEPKRRGRPSKGEAHE